MPLRLLIILVYNAHLSLTVSDMEYRTDDLRIREIKELLPPSAILSDFPITHNAARIVYETRQAVHRILHGADDRLAALSWGPCSIHDVKAAKEYARQTQGMQKTV